ncbi:hypothetical protein [Streptomyces yangpuensis]|uniref:hypothetical protein n=1 Tax=Streptomyces yangpuensis TaxID=1648182 RepID=UPI0022549D21
MDKGKQLLEDILNKAAKRRAESTVAFEQNIRGLVQGAGFELQEVTDSFARIRVHVDGSYESIYVLPWQETWRFSYFTNVKFAHAENFGVDLLSTLLVGNHTSKIGYWSLDEDDDGLALLCEWNAIEPAALSLDEFQRICYAVTRMGKQATQ